MKTTIPSLNWLLELEKATIVDSIDNDFILVEKPAFASTLDYPFKLDVTIVIICIEGISRGKVNLIPLTTASPGFATILPDQILEYEYMSEDFDGLIIIMSKRFTESLNIEKGFSLFLTLRDNPFIPLTLEELDAMVAFYTIMQRAVRKKDNPYRMEVVKHLIKAFFYNTGYQYHNLSNNEKKSKNEKLVESFLSIVQMHYKEQRGVEFYANELCLTPKYLSKVVKETSGKSANDWIDNHVILEAKALLKSTNMTIQQISDEFSFPSQSFFGKYFKRNVGLSPKEYKNS